MDDLSDILALDIQGDFVGRCQTAVIKIGNAVGVGCCQHLRPDVVGLRYPLIGGTFTLSLYKLFGFF